MKGDLMSFLVKFFFNSLKCFNCEKKDSQHNKQGLKE